MVKSVILSDDYQLENGRNSLTDDDLEDIALRIGRGEQIPFNQVEINELLDEKKLFDSVPPPTERTLFLAFLKIFRPALVFFGALGIIGVCLVLYDFWQRSWNHADLPLLFISFLSILWIPLVYLILFAAFKLGDIVKGSLRCSFFRQSKRAPNSKNRHTKQCKGPGQRSGKAK